MNDYDTNSSISIRKWNQISPVDLAWGQTRSRNRAWGKHDILAGSEPGAADRSLAMQTKKIFLASSSELKEDRQEFKSFIYDKCKEWNAKGVFLDLIMWEDFLDAVSKTRLQDEYNKAIRQCDVFVMLFFTKVGQYTAEEFETAFGQFQASRKPFIFTYFKDAPISTGSIDEDDLMSLLAFKKKLKTLGHFVTVYQNIDALKLHFNQQLDKLVAGGFIKFKPDKGDAAAAGGNTYNATLTGSGAIVQGGGTAVSERGVYVGGQNTGSINTGTRIDGDFVDGDKVLGSKISKQINTGGGAFVGGNVSAGRDFVGRDRLAQGLSPRDLEPLFAPLLAAVAQQAPAGQQAEAVQQVQALRAEIAKGQQADDSRMGKIVDGLVNMVPGAIGAVTSLFAAPILDGIAGPVTQFVLDKLKGR
ncbi:MAG: hypothetical protein RKR03_16340 [Candidatus Competibacter sp.]|nr:hypothetical protein [Candidatus Competibacter sp.]